MQLDKIYLTDIYDKVYSEMGHLSMTEHLTIKDVVDITEITGSDCRNRQWNE